MALPGSETRLRLPQSDFRETHENVPETPENAEHTEILSAAAAGLVVGTSWRRCRAAALRARQRAATGTTGPQKGEKIENSCPVSLAERGNGSRGKQNRSGGQSPRRIRISNIAVARLNQT